MENRTLIEQQIEDMDVFPSKREYLGYSIIGHKCKRYVLYSFRLAFYKTINPRKERLLNVGHAEEDILINELEEVGCTVFDQQLEVPGLQGHSGGHIDGKVLGVIDDPEETFLLECKTANNERFNAFKNLYDPETNHKGLIDYVPSYIWQINLYMMKTNLNKTLFVVKNKNTDERIYFIINFDKSICDMALRVEMDILTAKNQFERIGNGEKTWFECRMCEAKEKCFAMEPVDKNCRTCKYSDLEDGGCWSCSANKIDSIPFEKQIVGCDKYSVSDIFIT